MNSKLLKVCAMVMLIGGAGNLWCMEEGTGDEAAPSEIGGATVGVACKIKASVNVGFQGEDTEVQLFEDDGSKKSAEERTYTFSINEVAMSSKLLFTPQFPMRFDPEDGNGYYWKIKHEQSDDEIGVKLMLIAPGGTESEIISSSRQFESGEAYSGEAKEWKLRFDPQNVTSKVKGGSYKGSLLIRVVAAE